MPSLSPGDAPSSFEQILPGAPNAGFQSITTFVFRWKRYILYISNKQLNILRSPTELVQAITFDEELVAIRAESEDGGRFAVASANAVWILKPSTSAWNRVSWVQELRLCNTKNEIRTLSWGTEGELLVAGTSNLALFGTLPSSRVGSPASPAPNVSTLESRNAQWTRPIACPIRFAAFSPSSSFIATAGDLDRLVKIWRRLSYEEAIFDFAYLPHDGPVTHLEWRPVEKERTEQVPIDDASTKSYHGDEHREVLYTMSSDGHLRVWRTNNHNDLDILSLYITIDLVSAIPHSPVLTTHGASQRPARYALIIPAGSYSAAIAVALKKHPRGEVNHAIEHLKEVTSKNPDVVVSLDTHGRMSAWGLSSIDHKRRTDTGPEAAKAPFHIAHSESLGLDCHPGVPAAFETWFDGDMLNILAHSFGHSVKWWRGTVEDFSSSSALAKDRGEQIACWEGSTDQIAGLRTTGRSSFISWTASGSATEWSTTKHGALHASTHASLDSPILDADAVQRHKSLLLLSQKDVTLARVQDDKGLLSKAHPFTAGSELSLLQMHGSSGADERYMIYDRVGRYVTVLVNPSRGDWSSKEPAIEVSSSIRDLPIQSSSDAELIQAAAVVHPRKSGWLRLVGLDASGVLYRRDVSCTMIEGANSAATENILTFSSSIKAGSMAITSSCAAIISENGDELVIVDLKEGYIEHQQKLPGSARHLRLPSTSDDETALTEHSILAVAYDTSVDILARSRYAHHHGESSQWTTIKQVSIADIGSTISSLTWLGGGQLALAVGNCIFMTECKVSASSLNNDHRQQLELAGDAHSSVDELVSLMRAPVTCWQPRVLRRLLLHGHFNTVVAILSQLQTKLRFYTNGDKLDSLLGLDINQLLTRNSERTTDDIDLSELGDQLDELDLPFTSDDEQEKLKLVVRTVSYVSRHSQSLDTNAVRYLAHWRYHVLLEVRRAQQVTTNGDHRPHNDQAVDSAAQKAVPMMGWREINFAYHSTTQQPLLEVLVQYYENKLDWPTVRALGITLWLHNIKAAQSEGASMASVEQVFDAVGQSAYRSTQPPNPADASLFLLALRKKAVLLSLWRVAVGNREQKTTQNFLRRDFDVEENKTAARKNAYALMGKRRFQYAAAFFLLADDAISAISILAGQCEDLHLAVSVARAYCGDGSPIMQQFVQDRVLPGARKSVDRWLLSWANAITAQPAESLHALIIDANSLAASEDDQPIRTWQQDDPAALAFYRELRDKAKSNTSRPTQVEEYRAVLRSARVLCRMGFWLLALKLVQHWSFTQPQLVTERQEAAPPAESNGVPSILDQFEEPQTISAPVADTPSMLDAFSDNSTSASSPKSDADDRAAKAAALLAEMKAKNAAKKSAGPQESASSMLDETKKPTQFKEPASSSILDSFGF